MPVYEYVCLKCHNKTEVKASLEEKEKGLKPECLSCGSDKMVQFFGGMTVINQGAAGDSCCGPEGGSSCC